MKDLIRGKHLGALALLPAPKGVCPECGFDHEPYLPHNIGSLFYQYHFYNEHGRWPTQEDAMAHCSPVVKDMWMEAKAAVLAKRGNSKI